MATVEIHLFPADTRPGPNFGDPPLRQLLAAYHAS